MLNTLLWGKVMLVHWVNTKAQVYSSDWVISIRGEQGVKVVVRAEVHGGWCVHYSSIMEGGEQVTWGSES